MKFEYHYHIGPDGIVFSLINGADHIDSSISESDNMTIQKYVMLAWQEAVNKTSNGPDEIRRLMETEEGQILLRKRAEDYLAQLLEVVPEELNRRNQSDRRKAPRGQSTDRRYARSNSHH
ncbi:MAG: hypothetical protein AB1513_05700 [Pseudomonadota bacterium]